MYTCPCCGFQVFEREPGSFDICPICYWEDDIVQLAFPDMAGGANKCSLIEGQQNYERTGACEERVQNWVRPSKVSETRDLHWRRLDIELDRYLQWAKRGDHQLWQSVKDRQKLCVYYWLPDYWLLHQSR